MGTDLVVKTDYSLVMKEFKEREEMVQMMAENPHYATLGVGGIRALVAKAGTLDMDPFDAINGRLYYIKGKVGMASEEMAARIRAAGHSVVQDIERCSPTCIALKGKRRDTGDIWYVSFSLEDAKRARIMSPNSPWYTYPLDMCYNRALSRLFRQMTPDLSRGAGYTLDELQEITGTEAPAIAQVVEEEPVEEIVSVDQAYMLKMLFDECDPDYVKQVMKSLLKISNGKITTIEDIWEKLYPRLLTAATANRKEYKAAQEDEEEEEEELQVAQVAE